MDEALYKEYSEKLRFKFLRDLGYNALIEDLVHETFVIYLKALKEEKIKNPAKTASFLIGIANNLVMKNINFKKKRIEQPYDDCIQQSERENENPEMKFVQSEDERIVKSLLDKLNPMERKLIKLHYIEEKELKEIGDEMHISRANLKMRIYRIRKRLKKMIKT